MWRVIILAAITAAISSSTRAQTTEAVPAQAEPASPTILILRFETPGDVDNADWIGRAAQEDLATDLTRHTTARIKAPYEAKPIADSDIALKRAHELHATHVVFGQAQSIDNYVRLTGQVLDVATTKPLGILKITGPRSSLFDLEDALARQVCFVLPRDVLKPETLIALATDPPPTAIRLDDPEPEPIRIFPPYADADYSIPERYDSAPTIVINITAPSFNDVVPGYAPPVFGYGPYGYSPFDYAPYYGQDPNYVSAWYPYFNYPFGYGGIVVVNNGSNLLHHAFHHHPGFGHGRPGQGGAVAGGGGNGRMPGRQFAGNGADPVVFEFHTDGGNAFSPCIPANGFRPAVPAGGFGVGIPNTGYMVGPARLGGLRGPGGFRGPAFQNNIRGGSAVR